MCPGCFSGDAANVQRHPKDAYFGLFSGAERNCKTLGFYDYVLDFLQIGNIFIGYQHSSWMS